MEVKYQCPRSCQTCTETCENDPDYVFELINVEKNQTCSWIDRNPGKAEVRRLNYCFAEVGEFCPDACGFCQ